MAGSLVSNPFDSEPAARRYADGRLYYHHSAVGLAVRQLGVSHVGLAIDVGCGTGLSTRAVLEFADHVMAIDASRAMLRAAPPQPGAGYLVAAAERIPVRDAAADLATVGTAFHWFDQPRALAELARVLRPGAGLAVYSDFFRGQLSGQPGFRAWLQEVFLPGHPSPPRHAYFEPATALAAGFGPVTYTEDELHVPVTCTQLADYLLSQSNVAAAIESGAVSADILRAQFVGETAAFFPAGGHADAALGVRMWTTVRRS